MTILFDLMVFIIFSRFYPKIKHTRKCQVINWCPHNIQSKYTLIADGEEMREENKNTVFKHNTVYGANRQFLCDFIALAAFLIYSTLLPYVNRKGKNTFFFSYIDVSLFFLHITHSRSLVRSYNLVFTRTSPHST